MVFMDTGPDSEATAQSANWFQDHARRTAADEHVQVHTLEGGSRGWVGLGYVVRGTTKNNPGNESLKVLRTRSRVAWVSGETLH